MGKKKTIDPDTVISDFFKYVAQYRKASSCLSGTDQILFPKQHVRGLLIELSIKKYIYASGKVSWGHDLKELAREAVELGLVLNENDHKNIISNTNDLYFRGGEWDSDFICRYPKPNRGLMATVTPTHKMVDDMVERIITQAKKKRELKIEANKEKA